MRPLGATLLFLTLFFMGHTKATGNTPPGKPKLTMCRSPEKETFTCWWESGSDGGLPTTHSLYYHKDNSDTVYECPDYHTAGENSCFFNENETSIWVNYNITVVATNALGSNFSDPVDIDVVYIVQPHAPENVTGAVMEDKNGPFLRVSWEPPHKADTRSGWITLFYELRVKLEGEADWEEHRAGQQKMFNIFSLRSGETYLVQVRCKPYHGFWSEWSSTTYIKVPYSLAWERSFWILMTVFFAFIFLVLTLILNIKGRSVKHCLLPPVPGPKIKGFDKQLLKNGRSEEVFNALVMSGFPPIKSSDHEDLLVEYLEVYVPEEQEPMLEEGKNIQGCLKSKGSPFDRDSARLLLMDMCGERKAKEKQKEGSQGNEMQRHQTDCMEGEASHTQEEVVSPDMSNGGVKTWPSVFSPLSQYISRPQNQQGSLEKAKQLCLSDCLFPTSSTSPHLAQISHNTKDDLALGPGQRELSFGKKQSQLMQTQPHRHLQAHSYLNISSMECNQVANNQQPPFFQSTEYVGVKGVNQEDMILLQTLLSDHDQRRDCPQMPLEQGYKKVEGVNSGNMLLLQREVERMEEEGKGFPCDAQERHGETASCITIYTTATTQVAGKPTVCTGTAMPVQEKMILVENGYVDAATMLPAY